jgi:hypothetical protein
MIVRLFTYLLFLNSQLLSFIVILMSNRFSATK